MSNAKAVQLKPYIKAEVRELATAEAQSAALLAQLAKAAAESMNDALQVVLMETMLLTKHGNGNKAEAEHLAILSAAANKAARLSRVIFGVSEPGPNDCV